MTSLIHKLRWVYIRNNFQSFSFTVIYIMITMGLFFHRYRQYADTTVALALARASAIAIYWQSGLIMVLILRKSISFIRSFGLARYFPLDHYVYFHKVTGWSIAFFSLLHTLAHLYNFAKISDITTISYIDFLFSINLGIGWFFGTACITGWILVIILTVMLIFTLNFVRRTGNFEIFYYSHKLYVLYIIFLFLHASSMLQWLVGPLIFFLFEKISGYFQKHNNLHGRTYAIEGTMLPSRVLRLVIRKPKFFHFVPGDFVYLMVPSITKYEWHPMTISSAPEDDELTLHIRAVGEWTNRLYDHFDHAKTLTVKKMLEEWKCLNIHPLFSDTLRRNPSKSHLQMNQVEDIIMKRTMILPVPEDCDEDGCGKKKNTIEQIDKNNQTNDDVCIEMDPVSNDSHSSSSSDSGCSTKLKNNSQSSSNSNYNEENNLSKPIMLLKNAHQDLQTNAVFLKEPLNIFLDGPYGAPSSNIFESEHAVLIATGIGVTPFASILQSIMYRHIEKTRNCPACDYSWIEHVPSRHINNLKKVDFIWINRNQNSFEWFIDLMSKLEIQQSSISDRNDRFFDIYMYITNLESADNSLMTKYNNTINWHFGRPPWENIFENIRKRQRGKVTVFYCGRPDLSGFLRQKCSENDFVFKKEVF